MLPTTMNSMKKCLKLHPVSSASGILHRPSLRMQLHNTRMMSSSCKITGIKAREIIDSRGTPTVEVDITTTKNSGDKEEVHRAAVPSGASTGRYEAVEMRDGDAGRHLGKGVLKAVSNVNDIIGPELKSKSFDVADQRSVDDFLLKLDGSSNKENLGANAILGVSLAIARAGAAARGVPLFEHFAYLHGRDPKDEMIMPVGSYNVINGGSHAGNALAPQEFMIMPTGAPSFKEGMRMACEVYQHLKKVIKSQYGLDATNVGDEGGFAPGVHSAEETIGLLQRAISAAGYEGKIDIALDVAASEMWNKEANSYDMNFKGSPPELLTHGELRKVYEDLISKYPIVSIEDPFDEDDWDAYPAFTKAVGDKVQIVGDDLLVTNTEKIKKAIEKKACNALLLKYNQVGSVSETLDAVRMSQEQGWGVMTSHRSGETEDSSIAHIAVGLATGQIKTGAPARSERLAKYNELLRIEEQLGPRARYAGKSFRKPF